MLKVLYRTVLRRTSTLALVSVASAFYFERVFDSTADAIFENINKGKLWKDIKHKYEE